MAKKKFLEEVVDEEEVDRTGGVESASDKEEELERELADVPFEELQKAHSNGFDSAYRKLKSEQKTGRANKNRPMEITSKKPVGRHREVVQARKKVVWDPRFETLCGTPNTEGFRKRYNFLFDVELPAEREKLQKMIKKSRDPKILEELKNHVSWIDKQLKSVPTKSGADARILSEHKKKEREAAKHGKRPYYLKKSEIQKLKLKEKYNELQAAGKLEAYVEKRRRKNASKDRRYMPYRRPTENVQE